jgi:hypothetical protein
VEGRVTSFSQLRGSNSGLVNGQSPIGIYSFMWQNVGSLQTGYNKSQNEQFSLNAVGEASIKGHDLKFGLYYEQRVSRSYNVGANGLWQLMWQLTGRQDNGMRFDLDNPILLTDENGIFQNVVNYNLVVDPATQKNFDKNFRKYLMENGKVDSYGKPIDNTSLIDVNSYDPSDFKMEYFSADELLNQGNSLVSYFGYDYLGNKIRGKQSIESFTNDSIKLYRNENVVIPISKLFI